MLKRRTTYRNIAGRQTGHNLLAGHTIRIGILQDYACRSSNEETEFTRHFLYE